MFKFLPAQASTATHSDGDRTASILQLVGVNKEYRRGDERVKVLVDFDFTVAAGEFVVVTGPSGAGKSTLLHVAGGLDAPDAGTVFVAGLVLSFLSNSIWVKAPFSSSA